MRDLIDDHSSRRDDQWLKGLSIQVHGIHQLQEVRPQIVGQLVIIDDLEDWVEGVNIRKLLESHLIPTDVQVCS